MKHKPLFAILGAVAIAAGIIVWQNHARREPVIRGEDLSFWLGNYGSGAEEAADYKLALAEMDTRSVRYLVRELDWKPTPAPGKFQSKFQRFLPDLLARFFFPEGRPDHRAQALGILGKLGPLSKPAIPSLRKLAHDPVNSPGWKDSSLHGAAMATLILLGDESLDSCIGRLLDPKNHDWNVAWWATVCLRTNAAAAVPRLAQAFDSLNDQELRGRIAFPLRFIQSYPELSVPILKSLLGHEDKSVRFQAITGLANFGADAKSALPELRGLLQSDPSHREILTHAISRIESVSRAVKPSEPK